MVSKQRSEPLPQANPGGRPSALKLEHIAVAFPTSSDTFDRYDVPIGGITWHVKDGFFQKSLSVRQSS